MMEKIRTAANSIVVKIIFGIIILAFIFTGVGGFLGFSSSDNDERLYIAKIDGEGVVGRAAFEREAKVATQNAMTLGSDDSLTKTIRRSVLANLINEYLSYQLSKSLGIQISDEQVKNDILQQPVFFKNGRFNNQLYLELLAENGYTPDIYAEAVRANLQRKQTEDGLLFSDFVLPIDADILTLEKQQRSLYTASLSLENAIGDVAITDEQALEYYEENKESFYKKERVKVKYIVLDKRDFRNDILIKDITDKQVEEYYKEHKKEYIKPLMHSYDFIELDNKKTADALLIDLKKKNANFTAIAKENSLYPNIVSLGWFAMDDENNIPSFIARAKLTQKGSIGLVKDNGHYFILKLTDVEKQRQIPISLAKGPIKLDLWRQQVDDNYNQALAGIDNALNKQWDSIDELAQEVNLQNRVAETNWSYLDEQSTIIRFPELNDAIFDGSMFNENGSTGRISEMVHFSGDDSYYVMQVTDYQPEGIPQFELERENIIQQLTKAEMMEKFSDRVGEITNQLNDGERVDNLSFANRYTLSRNSEEFDRDTMDMIFSIVPSPSGATVYGSRITSVSNALIVALIAVIPGEVTEEESLAYLNQLQSVLANRNNAYLLNSLRTSAKIEIMPNSNL